ncbi:hypothetical protein IFM89_019019 [Coptis chinensis]|uniref:Uncharacterized protein n=1 Tax=Coptis chinensis TaxID=261450 RepID=A0A835HFN5_9MAGN|nr:hypothetical protein IFM89_019019 [Coptis chinensis]
MLLHNICLDKTPKARLTILGLRDPNVHRKSPGVSRGGGQRYILKRGLWLLSSVLIEIDLAKPIPHQFEVQEEEGKSFMQEVDVGKLIPKFCPHCKVVGHIINGGAEKLSEGEPTPTHPIYIPCSTQSQLENHIYD